MPRDIAKRHRLAHAQRCQLLGKLLGRRQRRTIDEHGNHRNLRRKSHAHLAANKVVRVVDPPTTLIISDPEPARPDDHQHRVTARHRGIDLGREVAARRHRGHVLEHVPCPEPGDQHVKEPPGPSAGVVTPIAQEDLHPVRSARRPYSGQWRPRAGPMCSVTSIPSTPAAQRSLAGISSLT